MKQCKRGEIWYANLGNGRGSEQGGLRPVIILQNDKGNLYAPTTIIAPLTSIIKKSTQPTHVQVGATQETKLKKRSVILLEQIRLIDKKRLVDYIGVVPIETMMRVGRAVSISLGLEKGV